MKTFEMNDDKQRAYWGIYFPAAKKHYEKVDIKGSYVEKAENVCDFLDTEHQDHKHFCIAYKKGTSNHSYHISNEGCSKFENNDTCFEVGCTYLEQLKKDKLTEKDDFKSKVMAAIDFAESKDGTYKEKKDRFVENFDGNVNIIVRSVGIASKFYITNGLYITQMRNKTRYVAWIY